MRKMLIIILFIAGIFFQVDAEEMPLVLQKKSRSSDLKNKPTAEDVMREVTEVYDRANQNRINNSNTPVDEELVLSDQHQAELREIVYLIQSVNVSPLSKARKDKIVAILKLSVYARSKPYKGVAGLYLLSLVPGLPDEETQDICIEFATRSYSDSRCVKALCDLLDSDDYSPSDNCRLEIYRGIKQWATNAELIECFKMEYAKDLSWEFKFDLAVRLAWCGDSTGVSTLIERLDANREKPNTRALIRAILVKLYSIDLGDNAKKWREFIEKNKEEAPR